MFSAAEVETVAKLSRRIVPARSHQREVGGFDAALVSVSSAPVKL